MGFKRLLRRSQAFTLGNGNSAKLYRVLEQAIYVAVEQCQRLGSRRSILMVRSERFHLHPWTASL